MFCGKCGARNPDDHAFCYKCGAQLNTAPQPDVDVDVNGGGSQKGTGGAAGYGTYGSGTTLYGGNAVAVSTVPMLPDGSPYERDDYLAISTEYKKQKIYNSTVWILLLFVEVIVSFILSFTFVNFLGIVCKLEVVSGAVGFLLILANGILLSFLLGRITDKLLKKRINGIGDTLYQRYLELLGQSNQMSISTLNTIS